MTIIQQTKPNALIIGTGGVGVIAAYSLSFQNKCNVSAVVRSDYDYLTNSSGYNITSCDYGKVENWKPDNIYSSVEKASEAGIFFDYIAVTTKNIPDGPTPLDKIVEPIINSNIINWDHDLDRSTNIVLIQNGIDIEHQLDKFSIDRNTREKPSVCCISGVQLICSTRVGKCLIDHKSKDNIIIGPFDPKDKLANEKSHEFIDLYFNEGHNMAEFDKDVRYTRWRKLIYNATINPLTALAELDYSRCYEFGDKEKRSDSGYYSSTEQKILRPAMAEVMCIAKSEGYELQQSDIEFFLNETKYICYKPSMCVDAENNQLTELVVLLGNPLKIAKKNGVYTPLLEMLYNLMVIKQNTIKERRGLIKFDEKTCKVIA
ncbi:related to ketopantoate reductase [Saccharomycodes ludwigii]|uniref:Related to ketopantoate reductase n=1 Tax=Saccharomycodes ludwigii TaxID=36035 RepID=A0A376B5J7_9ASCO|nr:hypothetical protein SCDLUD_000264 [Saccharomycodes ludwigii]KAH3902681.1 hypothetical protein SCDLUD_000264 [Saccharomycodes ludwigii]SSD59744.1 related to ketopantoate reductase [Saccharomycodes ludwigii]